MQYIWDKARPLPFIPSVWINESEKEDLLLPCIVVNIIGK